MMKHRTTRWLLLLPLALPFTLSCNIATLLNKTASQGGQNVGQVGEVQVLFINNTPFRAVFTFGSYDQFDQFTQPDFAQFVQNPGDGTVINGNAFTDATDIDCKRVLSLGSNNLLTVINQNLTDPDIVGDAFVQGISFYEVNPDTNEAINLIGKAPSLELLLGVDYPCGALLILRFEFDDVGELPFRTSFQLLAPE